MKDAVKKVLVTGSAGHLGEALCLTLTRAGVEVTGIDLKDSAQTSAVGSIADLEFVQKYMRGVDTVLHTATLHKPHVATHTKSDFIDCNVIGTQNLLQAAIECNVDRFIFTSTTSVYGYAMSAPAGAAAVWVTEQLAPVPKNIYGVTKLAAENLCRLAQQESGMCCAVLRTSRFFPEEDDSKAIRSRFSNDNSKANEFLNRRVELSDVVAAHLDAAHAIDELRFGCYIISATSPFSKAECGQLNMDAPKLVEQYYPDYPEIYARMGWAMYETLDRVYVNEKARQDLGWSPKYNFRTVLDHLAAHGVMPASGLAEQVGSKGYHDRKFENKPYPVLELN